MAADDKAQSWSWDLETRGQATAGRVASALTQYPFSGGFWAPELNDLPKA